nr:uncharacterized protein LOC107279316 isoform X2 [Oryza sativa Japonica Group]
MPPSTAAVLPENRGPAVGFKLSFHFASTLARPPSTPRRPPQLTRAAGMDRPNLAYLDIADGKRYTDKKQPGGKGTKAIFKRFNIALHLEYMFSTNYLVLFFTSTSLNSRAACFLSVGIGGSRVGLFLLIIISALLE